MPSSLPTRFNINQVISTPGGPQGPAGPQGPSGAAGAQGPAGPAGNLGTITQDVVVPSGTAAKVQGIMNVPISGATAAAGQSLVYDGSSQLHPVAVQPLFFTALSTLVATLTQQRVHISGYSAVHDGGQGYFDWHPTSTASADGGTIVQVTGVTTGRWIRVVPDKKLWVTWFGAKGDGVTDDSAAIQAAINASGFGNVVYLPNLAPNGSAPTTYLCANSLVIALASGATSGNWGVTLEGSAPAPGANFASSILAFNLPVISGTAASITTSATTYNCTLTGLSGLTSATKPGDMVAISNATNTDGPPEGAGTTNLINNGYFTITSVNVAAQSITFCGLNYQYGFSQTVGQAPCAYAPDSNNGNIHWKILHNGILNTSQFTTIEKLALLDTTARAGGYGGGNQPTVGSMIYSTNSGIPFTGGYVANTSLQLRDLNICGGIFGTNSGDVQPDTTTLLPTVTNCDIYEFKRVYFSFQLFTNARIIGAQSKQHVFEKCLFANGSYGIQLLNGSCVIRDCTAENHSVTDIMIEEAEDTIIIDGFQSENSGRFLIERRGVFAFGSYDHQMGVQVQANNIRWDSAQNYLATDTTVAGNAYACVIQLTQNGGFSMRCAEFTQGGTGFDGQQFPFMAIALSGYPSDYDTPNGSRYGAILENVAFSNSPFSGANFGVTPLVIGANSSTNYYYHTKNCVNNNGLGRDLYILDGAHCTNASVAPTTTFAALPGLFTPTTGSAQVSTVLAGTFSVTNGSATVNTTASQVGVLTAGTQVTFASQPAAVYKISSVSSGSFLMTGSYNGTTNAATTCSVNFATALSALSGTFGVTNGSNTVTTTVNLQALGYIGGTATPLSIQFASQLGVNYVVQNVGTAALTLATSYTGTTNASTTASGTNFSSDISLGPQASIYMIKLGTGGYFRLETATPTYLQLALPYPSGIASGTATTAAKVQNIGGVPGEGIVNLLTPTYQQTLTNGANLDLPNTNFTSVEWLGGGASATVSGIEYWGVADQNKTYTNLTGSAVLLKHEDAAETTPTNRIHSPTGGNISVQMSATLRWSVYVQRWVIESFDGSLASGITALTGDVTASGTGSVAATLAAVNSNVGSFGSSSTVPVITVNAKGLVTAVSTAAVTGGGTSVTGTGLWYSASGTLNAAAVGTSGDVALGALSGGNVPTTVVSLTGAGGTLPVSSTGALIQWAAGATAPGLGQAAAAGATGQPLTITSQAASSIAGTPGNIVLAIPEGASSASNAPSWVSYKYNSSEFLRIGMGLVQGNSPSVVGVTSLSFQSLTTFMRLASAADIYLDSSPLHFRNTSGTEFYTYTVAAGFTKVFTNSTTSVATSHTALASTAGAGAAGAAMSETAQAGQQSTGAAGGAGGARSIVAGAGGASVGVAGGVGGAVNVSSGAGGTGSTAGADGAVNIQVGGTTVLTFNDQGVTSANSNVTFAASGTTTVAASQQKFELLSINNGTVGGGVTLTAAATLALNGIVGIVYLDFSAVTLGAFGITITNGAGSFTATTLLGVKKLLTVNCPTANSLGGVG